MLEKAKQFKTHTIYRKGMGYYLYALQLMSENNVDEMVKKNILSFTPEFPDNCMAVVSTVLRMFTDLKNPVKFTMKRKQEAIEMFYEVLRYNTTPRVFKTKKAEEGEEEKKYSADELSADVIDTLVGGGYAFSSISQIFEEIDFYTFYQIKDRINERRCEEGMIAILVQHDPNGARKALLGLKGVQEIESWEDLSEALNG